MRFSIILAVLVLLTGTMASADYIYPTVVFNFDSESCSYMYTVTVSAQDSFPLGYLELDTLIQNAGATAWTMLGPDNVTVPWSTRYWRYGSSGCDAANWYVDTNLNQVEIDPSKGTWVGTFTLIAPNTRPGEGAALTMDGVPGSQNAFTIDVPGPVPEPGSLLALGTGLFGTASIFVRRRKS